MYKRQFIEPIFFGHESCEDDVVTLNGLIKYACDILSGLQQPDHPSDDKSAEKCRVAREQDEINLTLIRRDIHVALGGEEYNAK